MNSPASNKRIHRTIKAALAAALLSVAALAQAISMQDLFDGDSIVAGDKIFSDWTLEYDFSTPVIDFDNIDVLPLTTGGDPGLAYLGNGELVADDFNDVDFGFSYWVAPLDSNWRFWIKDNELIITDYNVVGAGGQIQIDETVFTSGGSLLCDKHVDIDTVFGTDIPYDACDFSPQPSLFVEKNVLLPVTDPGDQIELVRFEQRFSQVPVPPTLGLLAAGLAGAGLARRKIRR